MQTISYTAMRANLAKTMDNVCVDHNPVIITRSNAKPTVLISLEDFAMMEETNYLLKSPTNAKRLAQSIDEIEAMIATQGKKKNKK